jgi:hypothetical protein
LYLYLHYFYKLNIISFSIVANPLPGYKRQLSGSKDTFEPGLRNQSQSAGEQSIWMTPPPWVTDAKFAPLARSMMLCVLHIFGLGC